MSRPIRSLPLSSRLRPPTPTPRRLIFRFRCEGEHVPPPGAGSGVEAPDDQGTAAERKHLLGLNRKPKAVFKQWLAVLLAFERLFAQHHGLLVLATQPCSEKLVSHLLLWTAPDLITIVDDVITRGATFLALSQRLKEAYPQAEIRCFAVARTMSGVEVDQIMSPVEGLIWFSGTHLLRQP